MLSVFSRVLFVAALSLSLLTAGLGGPALGEDVDIVTDVQTEQLDGLPPARWGDSVSRPVETPMPFSMVGFTVPDGAELEFRTSEDGVAWSPWTEADVNPDDGPDPGTAEARAANRRVSEPEWVGEATHIQTRLHGEGAAARPENAEVHLIDSAGLGRSTGQRILDRIKAAWRGGPPPAQAAVSRPAIVSRKNWGADERLRKGSPSYASRIVAGVVHHTAGQNSYSKAQAPSVIRGIYAYHTRSNGWSDIGYNLLIDRYGTVYEGRAGGVAKPVIGAHAGGFNTGTFGVALVGSFDNANPPAVMRNTLDRVLAWKYDVHHVDVTGTTTYTSYGSTKYAAGRSVTINRLSGHRDVSATACPGANVYAGLGALRTRVSSLQGPVLLEPEASPTVAHVVNGTTATPITFTTRLRPAGTWQLRVRDASGNVVHVARANGVRTTRATVQWSPQGVAPGTYRWIFTSKDRRKAVGTVSLQYPSISASAAPRATYFGSDGTLRRPVKITGQLYDGAKWRVVVTDPDGTQVYARRGTGATASATWSGGATIPGAYTWTLRADDVTPVTGRVQLTADRVTRLGGQVQSPQAAAAISRASFPTAASHGVLTRSDLPNVAMPAAPLAGAHGPVLYTGRDTLPPATLRELNRVLPAGATLYVMGDETVVGSAVTGQLGRWNVVRVRGRNAFQIGEEAAKLLLARNVSKQLLVVGAGKWQQGIAAAAYGAHADVPVVLTKRDSVPAATRRALLLSTGATVVGNTDAVSDGVRKQIGATRIGGANPAAVSVAVARRLHQRTAAVADDEFVFANAGRADGWARAVAAGGHAAQRSAPLLLTNTKAVPAPTGRYLDNLGYAAGLMGTGRVLGNADHATNATRDALSGHLQ